MEFTKIFMTCLFIVFMILIGWGVKLELTLEKCDSDTLKLVSVNGIRDKDTGFGAGGTTKQKNLLFDNGLIFTIKDFKLGDTELILGRNYLVKRCIYESGRIDKNIKLMGGSVETNMNK